MPWSYKSSLSLPTSRVLTKTHSFVCLITVSYRYRYVAGGWMFEGVRNYKKFGNHCSTSYPFSIPSVIQPDLYAISFASHFIIPFLKFLINSRGFNSFYSHFLNWCCLLVTGISSFKCVKGSVWLLVITHYGQTNIIYINNIGITTKKCMTSYTQY